MKREQQNYLNFTQSSLLLSLSLLSSTTGQGRKQQHLVTQSCNHCFLISGAGHRFGHNYFLVQAALCSSLVLLVSSHNKIRFLLSLDDASLPYTCQESTFLICYLSHRSSAGIGQCLETNSVKGRPCCPVLDPHGKAVPLLSRTQVPPMVVYPGNDVQLDGND